MPLAKREQLKAAQHVALSSQRQPTSSSFTKQPLPDPSLVFGVGVGAFYMLISCHKELKRLNKTVEQTAGLLLEMKEQHQHRCEDLLSFSCSGSYHTHSTNVRNALSEGLHARMDRTGQVPFATRICNWDSFSEEHVSATQGVGKDQMAALAAELEAELELMELNISAGDILLNQSSICDAGEVSSKGLQNSYYSDTSSRGKAEAPNVGRLSTHTEGSQSEYGVSPIELEHRLREVLEAQQQERILELEKLLKETEAKLFAKEQEILDWKTHVESLTNLVHHASARGIHDRRCNNGAESTTLYDKFVADVPEVTKNTLEALRSFQDPPISTQVQYGERISSSNLPPNISNEEINVRNLTARVFSNDGNTFTKASHFSTSSHEGSLAGESNPCWDDRQGTGIDTPVFVVLDEFDAHTTAQKSESLRGRAVSKALVGESTASSGIKMVPSTLHPTTGKSETTGTSITPTDFGRTRTLDKDSSDVKDIVKSFKLKPTLDYWTSGQDVQAPKRHSKPKKESIQIVTKSLRDASSSEGSVEVKSPVLDMIRHYEALTGNARGKRL